jgi:HemY protein
VWTADGYVSATWRPVSPVSGRLDAFQWQTPVAALPSDKAAAIEPSPFEEAMLAPRREPLAKLENDVVEPEAIPVEAAEVEPEPAAAQDNSPLAIAPEPAPAVTPAPQPSPETPAPLFRARQDIPKVTPQNIPAVIPILRAPDDPGVDDEGGRDEFAEQIGPPQGQAGGWRGFLSRWGG